MKLWKYVLIVAMGFLLVACENMGGKKSRKVISCISPLVFYPDYALECYGDTADVIYNKAGKITMQALYHQGWKVDTDVSRAQEFMFILSK